jgi:hypothetical protein
MSNRVTFVLNNKNYSITGIPAIFINTCLTVGYIGGMAGLMTGFVVGTGAAAIAPIVGIRMAYIAARQYFQKSI